MDKLLDNLRLVCIAAFLVFMTWLTVAHGVYAIRHPDQTEMRRLLNTWDALMFRKTQ
jgi:hypothetical protein